MRTTQQRLARHSLDTLRKGLARATAAQDALYDRLFDHLPEHTEALRARRDATWAAYGSRKKADYTRAICGVLADLNDYGAFENELSDRAPGSAAKEAFTRFIAWLDEHTEDRARMREIVRAHVRALAELPVTACRAVLYAESVYRRVSAENIGSPEEACAMFERAVSREFGIRF